MKIYNRRGWIVDKEDLRRNGELKSLGYINGPFLRGSFYCAVLFSQKTAADWQFLKSWRAIAFECTFFCSRCGEKPKDVFAPDKVAYV